MDLLAELNPPQRQAVLHGEGPLLVFAGAGSGKTRVITFRIAHLVRERSLAPWQILAVTFTNKAAGEMRWRVGQLLGDRFRDAWIGTFHATSARLLRGYADRIGLNRDFVIYDDGDQRAMVTRCIKDLGLDERRVQPKAVQHRINAAKQECIGVDRYEAGDYFEDQVLRVYTLYEKRMGDASALDFADLLFRTVQMLEAAPRVADELQGRFRHLLVDEFQDTNHVQYRLLKALVGPERNLCVVGDDDQSIYRWRGADVRNILGFKKDFPETTVVTLEQNYRSTGRILRAAASVIARNRTRAPKTLWTENAEGGLVGIHTLPTERDEAAFVVATVRTERAAGRDPGSVAVLYRINAQARVLEEALRGADIPYRVVGGMRFYERAEVKDVIAYLRLVQNPDDTIDLLRIINSPPRGIGATTVERLQARAAAEGTSVWVALKRSCDDPISPAAARKRLSEFRDLVEALRAEHSTGTGVADLAAAVLERTGYMDALVRQDSAEADARIENLRELVGSFASFEAESEDPSLPALLERLSLVQDTDDLDSERDSVTLMTVHAAKGLEFPIVILTGMEERVFPYESREAQGEPEEIEEERRLCYVAITRAREKLLISNVICRRLFGTERFNPPSRFLGDIPAEVTAVHGSGAARQPHDLRAQWSDAPTWAPALPRAVRRDRTGRGAEDLGVRVVRDGPIAPAAADDETAGECAIRPGIQVLHKQFGLGRVVSVQQGTELKATVVFALAGRKTILARFLEIA